MILYILAYHFCYFQKRGNGKEWVMAQINLFLNMSVLTMRRKKKR